ncbi:MAG TPA: RluA family pseudouridine synthase [Thermoleophilaceae bacterium]|nr:RluA family pseudouridine synthase [Thermoleophilaceae bacterium]
MRLDAYLVDRGLMPTRGAAQRAIEQGRVTVDGRTRSKSHKVAPGEDVQVGPEPEQAPEAVPEVTFGVAYEDDELLVVDKPAGVVVHPGAGNEHGTLVQALAGRVAGGSDPERPGVVHRLDRDTSGLLVVARTEAAHAELSRMIREREVTRRYLALVDGRPPAASGTIDAPLGRDRKRRTVMSSDTDKPREAITHFELLEALPRTTLLDVKLQTGRTHQIRAHMQAIGHPVCGDPRYGGSAVGRRLGLERQFLHANLLMFRHPTTGEEVRCESKPPADLRRALDAARREPVSGGPDGH